MQSSANTVVLEEGEPADDEELFAIQIRAIMLQHAEDCKRMNPSDAGRLAMEAMAGVRRDTNERRAAASVGNEYNV